MTASLQVAVANDSKCHHTGQSRVGGHTAAGARAWEAAGEEHAGQPALHDSRVLLPSFRVPGELPPHILAAHDLAVGVAHAKDAGCERARRELRGAVQVVCQVAVRRGPEQHIRRRGAAESIEEPRVVGHVGQQHPVEALPSGHCLPQRTVHVTERESDPTLMRRRGARRLGCYPRQRHSTVDHVLERCGVPVAAGRGGLGKGDDAGEGLEVGPAQALPPGVARAPAPLLPLLHREQRHVWMPLAVGLGVLLREVRGALGDPRGQQRDFGLGVKAPFLRKHVPVLWRDRDLPREQLLLRDHLLDLRHLCSHLRVARILHPIHALLHHLHLVAHALDHVPLRLPRCLSLARPVSPDLRVVQLEHLRRRHYHPQPPFECLLHASPCRCITHHRGRRLCQLAEHEHGLLQPRAARGHDEGAEQEVDNEQSLVAVGCVGLLPQRSLLLHAPAQVCQQPHNHAHLRDRLCLDVVARHAQLRPGIPPSHPRARRSEHVPQKPPVAAPPEEEGGPAWLGEIRHGVRAVIVAHGVVLEGRVLRGPPQPHPHLLRRL
eukprot:2115595-Rhodomonas_salina.1